MRWWLISIYISSQQDVSYYTYLPTQMTWVDSQHRLAQTIVHHERNELQPYMLERLRQHVYQHSRGLVGGLLVPLVRHHVLDLVLVAPGGNLLQPVESVAEAGLGGRQRVVADPHGVPHALPEGAERALLQVTELAPFVGGDEPGRLDRKQAERVEHVVVEDLARRAVPAVQVVHARDGALGPVVGGRMANELPDQGGRVRVALQRRPGVRELGRLGQEARDGGDSVRL